MSDATDVRTVVDLLVRSTARSPSALAALSPDGSVQLAYSALTDAVGVMAASLRARGVGPADVVLVSMPNGQSMLTATLGAMCGAVAAPMNPAYTPAELERLADDVNAVAVVTEQGEGNVAADLASDRGLVLLEVDRRGEVVCAAAAGDMPAPRTDDVALLLHTAGTTARPKQVPLTHSNLAAAAGNVVESLSLAPDDRCLNVMPLFHSHGLLGAALSSLRAGASIVCARGMDPRRFLTWAEDNRCTWYTAASTLHQLVLTAPGEWPGLRLMRSASGPLPPQTAAALEARFGAPMIEVYGMTEAYQIAANPLPPGERRVGSVGRPTGTAVAVLEDDGHVRTSSGAGEILVRGPAVFAGYRSPADANDGAFLDGWFRTGDLGRISDDGYLFITGRLKEQINRGGEKISPREVEEALLDHPDVLDAMAFSISDPQLGEDVGVAVVLAPGAELDLASVRSYLTGRVAPFKVPRRVVVVDAIPTSATGKPKRRGFAEDHAEALRPSRARSTTVGEDGTTQWRLASLWQAVLELDEAPGPADRFFDLGGTSLAVMELVTRVEEDFGVDLPLLDVLEVPALADLAARLEELSHGGSRSRLLRRYRTGASGASLVLIPGQMGMAIGLNLIADAVDADVDIYLFDFPGHRPGEQPGRSIDELADALVRELEADDVRPTALYGNSLGGWVAYEAARRLESTRGVAPIVGIGDMYSPYFNSKASPSRPRLPTRVRNRLRRAARDLRRSRAARRGVNRSAAERRRDAVQAASEQARRTYEARAYGGEVLVVVASERAPKFGPTLGWEHHARGLVHSLRVGGGHSAMHRDQALAIGRALARMLEAAP